MDFKKLFFSNVKDPYGTLKPRLPMIVGSIVFLFIIISQFPLGTVGAGERGVRLRFSAVTGGVLDEGLYVRIPFVERIVIMDVQIQKEEARADAASKDLQTVDTTIAVNYHLDPQQTARIYQEVRFDYRDRIIAPAIQEAVKSGAAQFTAEQLITERPKVRDVMEVALQEKLTSRGIIVDSFNIVNFEFSDSFNTAIEAKVSAEQEALAAQNRLAKVKFEAEQNIEQAKGKAEAIRIEAAALRLNPAVLEMRAIEKWNGILPQVTGGSVPFVNIK